MNYIDFEHCNFSTDPGMHKPLLGPFLENIEAFLEDFDLIFNGDAIENIGTIRLYRTQLDYKNEDDFFSKTKNEVKVPLYIISMKVRDQKDGSQSDPLCIHCSSSGMRNNLLSKLKYHFIIPAEKKWPEPLDNPLGTDNTVFTDRNHLLHGLIHCNGVGHLICLNGREGGSKRISGREMMDLWDHICLYLQARRITVRDETSRAITLEINDEILLKRFLQLRLLFGVAYGHTWFGKWGYNFFHGSYGVSEHSYNESVRFLGLIHTLMSTIIVLCDIV